MQLVGRKEYCPDGFTVWTDVFYIFGQNGGNIRGEDSGIRIESIGGDIQLVTTINNIVLSSGGNITSSTSNDITLSIGPTGTMTLNGGNIVITPDVNLELPSNTLLGTGDNMYEEGSLAATTFSGTVWPATHDITVCYRRIGKMVQLYVPAIADTATGTLASIITCPAGTLPVSVRPPLDKTQVYIKLSNNIRGPGLFSTRTDGSLQAWNGYAATNTFPLAAGNSGWIDLTFTYCI